MESKTKKMILEVCVDRVRSAIHAELGGADRLELCQDLALGGTTPSKGLVVETKRAVRIPIMAMIRPRSGDFCYDETEFACMLEDILLMKELKVQGIVVGVLTPEGKVDTARMKKIMALAGDLEVTFHRAFDMTDDLDEALETLQVLGVTRVLTAGGCNKATEGLETIERLIAKDSSVIVMPGSGLHAKNIGQFQKIGACEFHLSGKHQVPSRMIYRKPNVAMGSADAASEFLIEEASVEKIRAAKECLLSESV